MTNGETDVSAVSSVGSIDRKNVPRMTKCRIMTQFAWVRRTLLGPTEGSEHGWFRHIEHSFIEDQLHSWLSSSS